MHSMDPIILPSATTSIKWEHLQQCSVIHDLHQARMVTNNEQVLMMRILLMLRKCIIASSIGQSMAWFVHLLIVVCLWVEKLSNCLAGTRGSKERRNRQESSCKVWLITAATCGFWPISFGSAGGSLNNSFINNNKDRRTASPLLRYFWMGTKYCD